MVISIGEKSPLKFEGEGYAIHYDGNGFCIYISLDNITRREEDFFSNKKLDIYFSKVNNQIAAFTLDFLGFLRSDVVFSINKTDFDSTSLITELGEYTNVISIILIEGTTQIVKKMRLVAVSQAMGEAIYEVCKMQENTSMENYDTNASCALNDNSTYDLVDKYKVAEHHFGV